VSKTGLESLRAQIEALPGGLRRHIEAVVAEARRLSRLHGVDEERAVMAAWTHDIARAMDLEELLRLARELGLNPSEVEEAAPILLHGPVAARLLASRYGVEDEEVLASARWHSTGRAGMSALEKVLFLADKVEPGKVAGRPDMEEVRRLAETDLDGAVLRYLDLQLLEAVRQGWPLHPDAVAARNELLLGRQRREQGSLRPSAPSHQQ
jgi:predicted HD superfamily hydrolase involved in NAD metabolism